MRYDYLFGNARLTTFIIQNAPVYVRPPKQADRKHFIWAGTIHRSFAVLDCVEFFKQYPEYTLVLKGGEEKKTRKFIDDHYKILLEQGRIVIDRSYLPSELFIDFLATFKIGFCFYSWDLINSNFNYKSAPSGKLFMYLAAGTPVIACNIPGFDFIREYGAGVLIDDYNPATIEKAVRQIQDNYDDYSRACIKAAQYFSFAKHVAPYIQFLLTTTSEAE
jgi:glycosyltransferase involved in cell wall biosynthesis